MAQISHSKNQKIIKRSKIERHNIIKEGLLEKKETVSNKIMTNSFRKITKKKT